MDPIAELKRKNEEIAARFKTVEERIAVADGPVTLFETWIDAMTSAFAIPFLWISLTDHPDNGPLLDALGDSPLLEDRLNVVGEDVLLGLLANGVTPVLVNEGLRPFFRLLPKKKYLIRSLAVAPLTDRTGRIAGSLNHGDSLPGRYDPRMDTSLLQSLAARVSVRLTEVGTF